MEEQSREVETPPPVLDGELHLLLGDLKDETSGYRRREAAWFSMVFHGLIVLALIFMPKWLPRTALIVPAHDKESTMFLDAPTSPAVKPPKSDIVSTQNHIAESKTPTVDKETLRKLLDARKAGLPKPSSPPPQPAGGEATQNPGPPQGGQPAPPQQTAEVSKINIPQPKQNPFAIASAGSSVDQAIRSAANSRPSTTSESFGGGEMGSGLRPKVDHRGALEILSDTRGVDFGQYLKRMKYAVQNHWDPLIPEVARPPIMKRGMLIIEFAIMKDGSIKAMQLIKSSGDQALDEAAWGALTSSTPLEKLPIEFSGDYLLLRAHFYYNPDTKEFE